MAKAISIRITKETPSTNVINESAKRLGISKGKLITEGINFMCGLSKESYDAMLDFFKRKQVEARTEFSKKYLEDINGCK